MAVVGRLDALQRRRSALGYPIAVVYKLLDDRGPHLAALIAFYAVLSLFPLLLLATSVLGYVLGDDAALQREVLSYALSSPAALQTQLEGSVKPLQGSTAAVVIGALGTLYGGLGVLQATQAALNRVYAVPRFAQPNPVVARLRSLALLLVLGLASLLAVAASVAVTRLGDLLPSAGVLLRVGAVLVPTAINTAIFLAVFHLLTARRHGLRDVLPGALLAAVGWQVLQLLGPVYASRYLAHSGAVYGTFGLVLGLIIWVYLQAFVVVVAAEVNVVARQRLWPRALLTVFRDDVDLTPQDEAVYTGYARAERYKGFEQVTATFAPGREEPDRSTFPDTGPVPRVVRSRRARRQREEARRRAAEAEAQPKTSGSGPRR